MTPPSAATESLVVQQLQARVQQLEAELLELRRVDAELEHEKVLLDGLMNAIPDDIYFKDRNGCYLRINAAKASRSGMLDVREAEGRTDFDFFQPEHATAAMQAEQAIMATGQPLVDQEEKLVWPDGHVSWVAATKVPLRNSAGEVLGTLGISRDITRQHEFEAQLQQQRDELRTLIDNLPDCIFFKDTNCVLQLVNKALVRMFKADSDREILGKTDYDFCPQDLADAYRLDDLRVLSGETLYNHEEQIVSPGGQRIWLLTTKVPLRNPEGKVTGLVGICRDITDLKRVVEELEGAKRQAEVANRAKSDFLANMSHEIRTPMNAIIGMTELVLGTRLTADQRDYLETVRDAGDSLMGIINDILDFSKIEAGKIDIESYPIELREWLGDAVKTLGVRAHGKGLELACDISSDVPRFVLGDGLRLRQIVLNLVGNSIKFTERGEVVLRVTVEDRTETHVVLHFRVTDTGIGITPDQQRRIFKAFEQADTTMTRRFGGTGLGLSISSRLVELMGGLIWVESKVGAGSEFHFTTKFSVTAQAPPTAVAPMDLARLHGLRVLIVDDNATNRHILSEMCLNWGMHPVTVPSATHGLEQLRLASTVGPAIDLVLTDACMPDVDGFTFADHIQQDESIRSTIVMMLTSIDRSAEAARCDELGIRSYLVKPVKQSDLFDAIVLALEGVSRAAVEPQITIEELSAIRPLRMLLVEDSLPNQKLACGLLSRWGHSLDVAKNGLEGVQAAAARQYDVILMDVQMPEMNGLEATSVIRGMEQGKGRHVPIIAMTAHAMRGDRDRCLQAGMDDYVAKPIRPKELARALARFFPPDSAGVSRPRPGIVPISEQLESGIVWSQALAACQDDEELLRSVIEAFLEETPRLLSELETCLHEQDAKTATRLAHTIKGNLRTFGTPAAETALQIEISAKADQIDSLTPTLQRLQNELAAVFRDVRQRLDA